MTADRLNVASYMWTLATAASVYNVIDVIVNTNRLYEDNEQASDHADIVWSAQHKC